MFAPAHMTTRFNQLACALIILSMAIFARGFTQVPGSAAKEAPRAHRWCNVPKTPLPGGVTHHCFRSPSMNIDVGYSIYLPPDYARDTRAHYPVVYWLHGGGGNELTGPAAMIPDADRAMRNGELPPMIIVFINGGPAWHYDDPASGQLGETAFIDELIPLVDRTYRTRADRNHRAIEGMSMGGRGTTRGIFKHPELFCSAAALAAGFGNEQKAVDAGQHLDNNVFYLAKKYAAGKAVPVRLLLVIGTQDFNYSSNLDYMKFLAQLKLPFEQIILTGVTHSNPQYYAQLKIATLKFHAESFRSADGSSDNPTHNPVVSREHHVQIK